MNKTEKPLRTFFGTASGLPGIALLISFFAVKPANPANFTGIPYNWTPWIAFVLLTIAGALLKPIW